MSMPGTEYLGTINAEEIRVCPCCGAKAWTHCERCGWESWLPPADPDECRTLDEDYTAGAMLMLADCDGLQTWRGLLAVDETWSMTDALARCDWAEGLMQQDRETFADRDALRLAREQRTRRPARGA